MTILEAKQVEKDFPMGTDTVTVLRGINVAVQEGSFVSIVGQSGSGKSTLLYTLSGLEKPTKGKVTFGETELSALSDAEMSRLRRRQFGFVFQFYNLIPTLTVEENVALPLELDGLRPKQYRDRVRIVLEQVGLAEKAGQLPYQLSGGQQQRVAIARALAIDPAILFADEPTGNLDSQTGEEILNLMQNLCRKLNKTVVMVTHDMKAAESADRTIRLKDGAVV